MSVSKPIGTVQPQSRGCKQQPNCRRLLERTTGQSVLASPLAATTRQQYHSFLGPVLLAEQAGVHLDVTYERQAQGSALAFPHWLTVKGIEVLEGMEYHHHGYRGYSQRSSQLDIHGAISVCRCFSLNNRSSPKQPDSLRCSALCPQQYAQQYGSRSDER
ncbi:unnamed protein product [Pleuronectes platessa]|uniref:Uncharacterized protein n=1 Tax=Pleuronectes platessa TaxID=8262 RepID=A0A9N7VQA2_PLEPL|nr:unnamed protein product [Pleuronectes platessa]